MKKKKIVYVDLDGVIADFNKAVKNHPTESGTKRPDLIPGIYRDLDLIEGAQEGLDYLTKHFDTYILSGPSWDNYDSWTHKRLWVGENLDKYFRRKLILCNHKSLLMGDYLIDDHGLNGAKDFKGVWIHYTKGRFEKWTNVVSFLSYEN